MSLLTKVKSTRSPSMRYRNAPARMSMSKQPPATAGQRLQVPSLRSSSQTRASKLPVLDVNNTSTGKRRTPGQTNTVCPSLSTDRPSAIKKAKTNKQKDSQQKEKEGKKGMSGHKDSPSYDNVSSGGVSDNLSERSQTATTGNTSMTTAPGSALKVLKRSITYRVLIPTQISALPRVFLPWLTQARQESLTPAQNTCPASLLPTQLIPGTWLTTR